MRYTKLSRLKFIFLLVAIIFLAAIYKDVIMEYIKFDPTATDLGGIDGYSLRRDFLLNGLSLETVMFYFNTEKIFFFPALMLLVLKDYSDISRCIVKWNIGKNNKYSKELIKCKFELSIYPVITYLFCVLVSLLIAYFAGVLTLNHSYFEFFLVKDSFGSDLFNNSAIAYTVLRVFITALMLYINAVFTMCIYDFVHNYLRAGLLYLAFIIILSVLMYNLNLWYISPMTSFVGFTYINIYLFMLFTPLITYAICLVLMKVKKYEL